MNVTPTELPEVLLIEPRAHADARGFFMEIWSGPQYEKWGVPATMRQDNLSWSRRGVLRGLHVQHPAGQGKLVYVLAGQVFDVAVDVRVGSPRFGRFTSAELSFENRRQLYVPEGFAHGFCVLSDAALVAYKCTETYRPDCEIGIDWNDPAIGVPWPVASPILSAKDASLPRLSDIPTDCLPKHIDAAHRHATDARAA
ncbi:MAG: dTDP-4-dehydrorhamnose 3,5-epimerase [Planctomycetia bacterium]|nr:dTDP-4-dehydrorhamnose 3,5-epimerase [Planctomycetia bacterium]